MRTAHLPSDVAHLTRWGAVTQPVLCNIISELRVVQDGEVASIVVGEVAWSLGASEVHVRPHGCEHLFIQESIPGVPHITTSTHLLQQATGGLLCSLAFSFNPLGLLPGSSQDSWCGGLVVQGLTPALAQQLPAPAVVIPRPGRRETRSNSSSRQVCVRLCVCYRICVSTVSSQSVSQCV